VADQFGEPAFENCRSRAEEAVSAFEGGANRIGHCRVVMAQDVRRKRGVIVDVALAVRAPDIGALAFQENDFRIGGPVRGYHTARYASAVSFKDGGGLGILAHCNSSSFSEAALMKPAVLFNWTTR